MGTIISIEAGCLEKLRSRHESKRELAQRLEISEGTLNSLLDGSWSVLDRRLLERLLDELECTPGEFFAVTESPFFDPLRAIGQFKGTPRCYLVTPPHSPSEQPRDHEAIDVLEDFLRDNVQGVSLFTGPPNDEATLEGLLADGSCMIIGGPRANPYAEIALCLPFGIPPFGELAGSSPFWFIDGRPGVRESSLVARQPVAGFDEEFGIYASAEQQVVKSELHERDSRHGLDLRGAPDAGIVLVQNRTLPSGERRKVIVVAGVSRIGTLAAADAVIKDYRDLEPEDGEPVVWGIVRGLYNKPRGKSRRQYREYQWIMREGGRKPMKFSLKKGVKSAGSEDSSTVTGTDE